MADEEEEKLGGWVDQESSSPSLPNSPSFQPVAHEANSGNEDAGPAQVESSEPDSGAKDMHGEMGGATAKSQTAEGRPPGAEEPSSTQDKAQASEEPPNEGDAHSLERKSTQGALDSKHPQELAAASEEAQAVPAAVAVTAAPELERSATEAAGGAPAPEESSMQQTEQRSGAEGPEDSAEGAEQQQQQQQQQGDHQPQQQQGDHQPQQQQQQRQEDHQPQQQQQQQQRQEDHQPPPQQQQQRMGSEADPSIEGRGQEPEGNVEGRGRVTKGHAERSEQGPEGGAAHANGEAQSKERIDQEQHQQQQKQHREGSAGARNPIKEAETGVPGVSSQDSNDPKERPRISFSAGKIGATSASTASSKPSPVQSFKARAAQNASNQTDPSNMSAFKVSQEQSKENELGQRLSNEPDGGEEDDLSEEAKRLVPFHLVDSTAFQYRPSSGRAMRSLASMKQTSYKGNRPLSSEHPYSGSNTSRGTPQKQTSPSYARPSSGSNLMPFQPVKPPRQPSRPSSNKPGPFGIRGFNQQQSRMPSYEGQGSEGARLDSTPLTGMVSVQGQASRGETPADYMRGHAKGAMSRGASKRHPEGEDFAYSRMNSAKSRFSGRWEEESNFGGVDVRSAAHPDRPTKVFRNAKLGGHTAGVGGHAAKLMEMGMEQQDGAHQHALHQHPGLGELFKVKAVSHGDRAVTVDQQKRRKPGQLISALHRDRLPGATFIKDKEGQTRRILAAAQNMYGPQPMKRKYIPRPPTPDGITLDGFLLLEAGNDELPEGVVVARLPSRNIQNVEVADMTYFTALKVLDLADNRVPDMTLLAPLLGIRALSLAMNRLGPVPLGGMLGDPGANAFQMLSTLDLSYNSLDANATLGPSSPLSHLPALCELNLSGNKWLTLPHTLGPFTALELLKLADNALMSSCLPTLAALPSLKLLGLARNHMDGIMGVDGREGSLQEALALANLDVRTAFRSLQTLDLTRNHVKSEDAIKPLQLLPCLKSVILAGNPLAVKQVQATKRAGERRANALARANSGAVPGPELLQQQQASSPLWVYEAVGQLGPKPSVGRVLTGSGGHFVAVQEPLGRHDATKAATLAAVTAAVPEEAVTEVFDRADAAIEVWQLNTVPEEEEGEDESEDDNEPDGTFLTGVGITEKAPKAPPPVEEPPPMPEPAQEPSDTSSHSLWEDVSDPTERLALALGLDPSQLAIHTGIPTTDATGSVNALRHALAHPLVELGEGLGPAPRHLELTAAAKAKQRPRLQPIGQPGATFVTAFGRTQAANPKRARTGASGMQGQNLQVGPGASEHTIPEAAPQSAFPSDPHTVRVQHVEGMLTGMRSRLDALQGTLVNQLSMLPPSVTARAQRSIHRRMSRSPSGACTPTAHSPGPSRIGSPATLHQKLQQQEQQQRPLSPFAASMSVDEDDDEADAEEQLLEPDSPDSNPSQTWPRQSGRPTHGVDPNDSDASSLPDDVVEAIENSDPSGSSGGESDSSNADKRGSSRKELPSGLQRPPLLQQPRSGNQRYSPSAHKKSTPKDLGRAASPAR